MKGKINWTNHLIELVVVIIGISIAFALNNWRDGRANARVEYQYLEGLRDNLRYDLGRLDFLIREDSGKAASLNTLLGYTRGVPVTNDSLLFASFMDNMYYVPFTPQSTTYETLTGSGAIGSIRDHDLRVSIVELYTQRYEGLMIVDESITQHTEAFTAPYLVNEIRFEGYFKMNNAFLTDYRFVNIMHGQQGLLYRRMGMYQGAKQNVEDLLVKIEDQIKE